MIWTVDIAGQFVTVADLQMAGLYGHDCDLISRHWKPNPGDVFIDVGCGPGTWTLYSAVAGCFVYAFDPKEYSLNLVRQQLALNTISNKCELIQKGCWSSSGEIPFGENSCLQPGDTHRTTIPVISLDEFPIGRSLTRVDCINIDAEWAEVEIIKGARLLLTAFRPKLIIEIHDESLRPLVANELTSLHVGYSHIHEPGFLISSTKVKQ